MSTRDGWRDVSFGRWQPVRHAARVAPSPVGSRRRMRNARCDAFLRGPPPIGVTLMLSTPRSNAQSPQMTVSSGSKLCVMSYVRAPLASRRWRRRGHEWAACRAPRPRSRRSGIRGAPPRRASRRRAPSPRGRVRRLVDLRRRTLCLRVECVLEHVRRSRYGMPASSHSPRFSVVGRTVVLATLKAHREGVEQVAIRRRAKPERDAAVRLGGSDASQFSHSLDADGSEPPDGDVSNVGQGFEVVIVLVAHRSGLRNYETFERRGRREAAEAAEKTRQTSCRQSAACRWLDHFLVCFSGLSAALCVKRVVPSSSRPSASWICNRSPSRSSRSTHVA